MGSVAWVVFEMFKRGGTRKVNADALAVNVTSSAGSDTDMFGSIICNLAFQVAEFRTACEGWAAWFIAF